MKNPEFSKSRSRGSKAAAKLRDMLYEQLEERVLFDAVPTGPVDPSAEDIGSLDQANAERFDSSLYAEDVKVVSDASLVARDDTSATPAADVTRELVIVDTSVENYQQLVDDLLGDDDPSRHFDVVTIDGSRDGIEQVSAVLSGYSDLDALHIVSHGDDFGVQLGNIWLTRDNLGGYAAEIAQWGNALTADGDLLLLGCDLASSADGRELLQSISTLTGADVAASTDDTGYAPRGGNWDLEYILGEMETSIAFSDDLQDSWQGLLAPGPDVTITTQNGNPQIGDDVQFTVTFDNTAAAGSGDTGYGPFIDLLFPVNGADGAAGSDTADGLDFTSATYLGQPVTAIELTFNDVDGAFNDGGTPGDAADDSGSGTFGFVTHPYATAIQNELQLVQFSGQIDGGTLGIAVDGEATTIDLSGTSGVLNSASLQAALEGLSNIGAGNVTVNGDMTDGFFVEFVGALAMTDVPAITLDNTLLENGGLTTNPRGVFTAATITDGDAGPQAIKVYGTPGDKLVILELPFGSVTPEQPEIAVSVNATMSNLADLYDAGRPETELTVTTRSGFRYGSDALDNSDVDPSILSDSQTNAGDWVRSASIRPSLMTIVTDVVSPEDETATGPNYPREFVVQVDLPEGQTIQNLDISDLLPDNLVFLSLDSIVSPDGDVVFTTNVPAGNNSQGNPTNNSGYNGANAATPIDVSNPRSNQSLVVTADEVTGANGTDVTIRFTGYITEVAGDDSGNPTTSVIPLNGEDDLAASTSEHTATALGDWLATDPRDVGPGSTDNASAGPHSSEVDSKSIAVQKSVSVVGGGSTASPGKILEYTLSFQISDYFTFGDLVLTDTFSDGQRFYNATGYEAAFTVSDFNATHTSQQFNVHVGAENSATTENASDNFIVDQSQIDTTDNATEVGDGTYTGGAADPTDGSTSITIQLSEALAAIVGEDGILQGGHSTDGDTNNNNLGSATGTITFYTVVQDEFSDDFASGDRSVDHNDRLTNDVTVTGSVRENAEDGNINNSVGTESDTSSAEIGIESGTLTKDVYAINGDTNVPSSLVLSPGDDVTYRLTYTLPSSDFENLVITDYLPLPALVADDFNADDSGGDNWTFNLAGSFDTTAPVAGVVEFGANDTFYNSNVSNGSDYFANANITVDSAANSLEFDFESYDDPTNQSTTIELLFTVTLQDDAFADGLLLTNIARAQYGATNQTTAPTDAIIQIKLGQPVLNIKKGIVDTDNATAIVDPAGPTINDEYQSLASSGSNVGGVFQLSFGGQTTSNIAVGSSAAQVQSALESLSSIGTGNVTVYGGKLVDEPLVVQFTGALAGTDVAALVSNAVDVTVGTELEGGEAITINGIGNAAPFTGRVTSGALDTQLIDLDVTDAIQVGDTVRFMIVVENTGTGANGAFDVQLKDQLPAEFEYVAGSLSVVDGQGTSLNFVPLGGHPDHALFGNGIMLDDPGATGSVGGGIDGGALDSFSPYDGRNITVITYDAKLVDEVAFSNDNVDRGETITNQAVLVNYAGADGAEDHTAFVNEKQTLSTTDTLTGGTFTLTFDGQTTSAIDWDATASDIEAALLALSNIGADNVRVTGDQLSESSVQIEFFGDLSDTNVAAITVDDSSLAGSPTLIVATTQDGSLNELQRIAASGSVTGGTYTLTFDGEETTDIAYNADAATIQAALETLNSIPAGSVIVSGDDLPNSPVTIELTGALSSQNVQAIAVDASNLTGGGSYSASTTRGGQALDPSDGASVTIGADPTATKAVIATSEAHTGNDGSGDPLVAVGEIVRYQVQISLPGGTLPNLRIYDSLPNGLTYIDDGTATISFVSDTPGSIVSSTLTSGVLPDDAVSRNADDNRDNYSSGSDIWFKLGDVTNAEYEDGNDEFAVLEFNVLVTNNGTSVSGNSRLNDLQLWVGESGSEEEAFDLANGDRPRVTVVEPNISAPQKEISDGAGGWVDSVTADAGDSVTFRLSFNNGNGNDDSDAFDVRVVDSVPDDFTLTGVQVYVDTVLQTTGVDYSDSTSGNNIDLTLTTVGKGESVEIVYTTTVDGTAQPGETLQNQAFVTWTSLPGEFGTADGAGGNNTGSDLASLDDFDTDASGTDDGSGRVYSTESGETYGERNGSGAGTNDHLGNDTASVNIAAVDFAKELVGTSVDDTGGREVNTTDEAVIGEEVQYKFTITVPEGTVNAAEVFDQLDEGLEFVRVDSISASAGLSSSIANMLSTASVVESNITTNGGTGDTGDAQALTFSLGNITNSDTNNATDETIEITYSVRVKNIVANQSTAISSGPSLNNVARFRWDTDGSAGFDQQTATSSATNVAIIEPVIDIDKSIISVDQDAGDPVAYTIVIKHNDATVAGGDSETDAFDLTFFDDLPDAVDFVGFTVVHSDAAKTIGFAANFEYVAGSHRVQTVGGGSFDLLLGEEITIAIAGTIAADVGSGQQISNTANVD